MACICERYRAYKSTITLPQNLHPTSPLSFISSAWFLSLVTGLLLDSNDGLALFMNYQYTSVKSFFEVSGHLWSWTIILMNFHSVKIVLIAVGFDKHSTRVIIIYQNDDSFYWISREFSSRIVSLLHYKHYMDLYAAPVHKFLSVVRALEWKSSLQFFILAIRMDNFYLPS